MGQGVHSPVRSASFHDYPLPPRTAVRTVFLVDPARRVDGGSEPLQGTWDYVQLTN